MNYRQPLSHDAVNIRADCNVLTAQCQSFWAPKEDYSTSPTAGLRRQGTDRAPFWSY